MTVSDSARWGFPDSDICSAALQLATDVSPAFITNHCVRSWVLGDAMTLRHTIGQVPLVVPA